MQAEASTQTESGRAAASSYGFAADWWSFGVLLFEMFTGCVVPASSKKFK